MLILGGAAVVNALSGMDIYAASFLIPLAAAPFTMQGADHSLARKTREGAAAPASGCVLKCGSEKREWEGPEPLGA